MKKSMNLLVLTAFLSTTFPITPLYARGQDDSQEEVIEVPLEAVSLSEQLVQDNENNSSQSESSDESKPSCIKSGVAYSPKMTKAQRKELFVKGQITDCEGNIWNIKVIPGSDVSKQMTIKSWRYAGKQTKQMFKIETYKKAARDGKNASKASFNFAKDSSKLLKKGVWDYMIVDGLYKDLIVSNGKVWKDAAVTVSHLRGSFAWLFGAIYAGILKPVTLTGVNVLKAAYHITAGTVILVGGVAGTAGGIIATVASPVIVPLVEVMTHPLLAVGSILTTGSIVPGVVYVWNGTAWVSTQFSHVPDSETQIGGVKFVRLENPKQPQKPVVTVTSANLSQVISVGIKSATKKSQEDQLTAQRNEIDKQIRALQEQSSALNNQIYALEDKYNNDPAVVQVNELSQKVYTSDITIKQDVLDAVANEQELKELVQKAASEQGMTLSDAELDTAVKKIQSTMKYLGAK